MNVFGSRNSQLHIPVLVLSCEEVVLNYSCTLVLDELCTKSQVGVVFVVVCVLSVTRFISASNRKILYLIDEKA